MRSKSLLISMSNLSPAAQAVLRAAYDAQDEWDMSEAIAAALRAAGMYCKRDRVQLFSIADELDPCPEV